jgi:protein-L-isoaspartate(D-aspartate) O-methyltransferase
MRTADRSLPFLLMLGFAPACPAQSSHEELVRDYIGPAIRDERVLSAFRDIRRDRFVPVALRPFAWRDTPLPIGQGQTISQPSLVAMMTELLQPKPDHRMLEIGTGSGYQAAILSKLVRHVYTIEIVPELAASARHTLADERLTNVTVRHGDGYKGWPEQAPFDGIILTAAPPEIPQALIDQLRPRGRLVAPVGTLAQELVVIEKDEKGRITRRSGIPVRFVPMVPAK